MEWNFDTMEEHLLTMPKRDNMKVTGVGRVMQWMPFGILWKF